MNFLIDFLKDRYKDILIVFLLLIAVLLSILVLYKINDKKSVNNTVIENEITKEKTPTVGESLLKVDIKGAVKKPGVYELNSDCIINDAIKLAGGLNKNAYTKNINLSKKVQDEMVIYVYTKTEFKKLNVSDKLTECQTNNYDIKDCIDSGNSLIINGSEENKTDDVNSENNLTEKNQIDEVNNENNTILKIPINIATKEELMTLNGIGESKAISIIEYRNLNGPFKTIEDIMNVSGIGEKAFEKIKDNITV